MTARRPATWAAATRSPASSAPKVSPSVSTRASGSPQASPRATSTRRPSSTFSRYALGPSRISNVAVHGSDAPGSKNVPRLSSHESVPTGPSGATTGERAPHRPSAATTGASSAPQLVSSYTRAADGGGSVRRRTTPTSSSSRSRWARIVGPAPGSPAWRST
nr:hypothetical protein [Phytohabitans flavus]